MKTVLFCTEKYSYNILKPLAEELTKSEDEYIWYVAPQLFDEFPYKHMMHTNSIKYLDEFKADVIFTPMEKIPYWLHGIKVHIFNSLVESDEKYYQEIINYFDLYLTSGPKFTRIFERLAEKHGDFEVIETGWSKLDRLFSFEEDNIEWERDKFLAKHNVKYLVLYAPSSDKELSSALKLKEIIAKLGLRDDILFMIYFDDNIDEGVLSQYKEIKSKNILILEEDDDIMKYMHMANLLISDTNPLLYEFILLDKPIFTVDTRFKNITWSNMGAGGIYLNVIRNLESSVATRNRRYQTIAEHHPYNDGKSAHRMVEAVRKYIKNHKIPKERRVPFLKKWKINREFKEIRI